MSSSSNPTAAFTAAIAAAQAQLQRSVAAPNADPAQTALLQQQMQQAIVVAAMALMPTLTGGVPGSASGSSSLSLPPSLPTTTSFISTATPAAPPMPPSTASASSARPTRRQSFGATGGRRNADGTIVSVGGSPTNLAGTGFGGQEKKSSRKSLVGKGELDECTFKPKITPLPSQYSNSTVAYRQIESLAASRGFEGSAVGVPFNDRVSAWEKAKREELVKAAEERAKRELEECTFTPKVSATSREVAKARGGGNNDHVDIHERLFRESFVGGNGHAAIAARQFSGSASFAAQDAALNESSTLRGRDSAVRAVGMLSTGRPLYPGIEISGTPVAATSGSHLDSIEQKQLAECTFQPKVNTVLDARPVRSRYRDPTPTRGRGTSETPSDGRHPPPLPSGVAECTFMPQTNTVRPLTMPAAAVYVQVPIFERLAKTQTASQREREREVQEDQQRVLETQAALETPTQPSLPSSARDPKLQEFLSRQEAAAAKKEADIEAQRQMNAPTLQPALCEKSLRIVRAKGSGRFLDRVVHESIAKEHDQLRTQAMLGNDPECTFAPAINPSSRAMRPRSVVDMSRGDALKRETAARLLRLKLEQEDLQGITFKPAINERSRHTEGRLRILSEPESYVARVKAVQANQVDRIRRQMQQAEATELAECTFTPAVHSAPEYVSRIAQSMALARSVKQLAPPARPDWR